MLPYSELHIFPLGQRDLRSVCSQSSVLSSTPPPKFKKLAPPLLRSSPTPSTKQRPLVDSSRLTVQCSRWYFVTLTRYKTTVTQLLFWSYLFFSSVGEMFFHQLPWVPLTKWWMMTFNKKTNKKARLFPSFKILLLLTALLWDKCHSSSIKDGLPMKLVARTRKRNDV